MRIDGIFKKVFMMKRNDDQHPVNGDSLDASGRIHPPDIMTVTHEIERDREMDQLLYALSHDLRAPVRAITGFGNILLEDYAELLDDTGKDYLQRMIAAGDKLNAYIDGLLHLSRSTRGDICIEPVDLSALCRDIIRKLKERQPERRVSVTVQEDILVPTDRRLARIMLEKLLENAWKYTTPQDQADIRFGMIPGEKGMVFYVQDNGVGFDMRYAQDRLFGIFQRMHTSEEFVGTGIGLATAKRIIHRLGGKIWARSQIGKGTQVFFVLEKSIEPDGPAMQEQ